MSGRKVSDVFALLIAVMVCQSAGIVGSFFTRSAIPGWYATLEKPFFTPPSWVFAPVWIILYGIMGIAVFLIWRKGFHTRQVQTACASFAIQLILNALWPVMFFGLRSPVFGLVEIIVLWATVLITIRYFFRLSKVAGWMMVPYVAWVSFAVVLNFSIWWINT